MLSLDELAKKWRASIDVATFGPEIQVFGDSAGRQFDQALRKIVRTISEGYESPWVDLLSAARLVRWRRLFDPTQSFSANEDLFSTLITSSTQMRHIVDEATVAMLDDLDAAMRRFAELPSPLGAALLESLVEIGPSDVLVQVASARIRLSTQAWLLTCGMQPEVAVVGARTPRTFQQSYVLGQPSRFPPRVVLSPAADELAFLVPDWLTNRDLPRSEFSELAEGRIRYRSRVSEAKPASTLESHDDIPVEERELWPAIHWSTLQAEGPSRPPGVDEVLAHRYLLAGGSGIFLEEDGELVRRFFPDHPPGERVDLGQVQSLVVGDFLVLRTENGAQESLLAEAIESMGQRGASALKSQQLWKAQLRGRLSQLGPAEVAQQLRAAGVRHYQQGTSWVGEDVSRPRRVEDFTQLLAWLDIPAEPSLGWATEILRARMKVGHRIRTELEVSLSSTDLSPLRTTGFMSLGTAIMGRSMFVARVMGITPQPEIVLRNDLRTPFKDGTRTWLE